MWKPKFRMVRRPRTRKVVKVIKAPTNRVAPQNNIVSNEVRLYTQPVAFGVAIK